jgi:hypothetical protein
MTPTGADFLSRIAAKAVGDAALVEPRLASRFEAAAGGGDWLAGWSDEPDPAAAGAAWLEAPPPPSVARPPASEAAPAHISIAETGDPVSAKAPDRAKVRPRPTEAEPGAPAQAASAPDSAPPSLVAVAEVGFAVADGARPLPAPPAPFPRERRMEAKPPPPHDSGSIPAPPAREPEEAPLGRTGPLRAERARSSPPAPPVLTPQPSARALAMPARPSEIRPRPSRRERAAPGPVPPPPVVNITIGRVDVRAPAPAAPAARAQPPRTAPQSLADYLKRRGGGR